jgi:uncharacterized 2Fe-2S/4Fe-4S cluster protein (DUF4445 family)
MTVRITILPEGRTIEVDPDRSLADGLAEHGLRLSLYCGQRGICGKCFVEIVEGDPGIPEPIERRFIESRRLPPRSRMACRYRPPRSGVAIRVPGASLLQEMPVFRTGISRRIVPDPAVKKIALGIAPAEAADPESLLDRILEGFRPGKPRLPLPLLSEFARRYAPSGDPASVWTAVLYNDDEVIALEPGDTSGSGIGLAVDLGTTTMVAELVELDGGRVLASAASVNPQTAFGADVVSRITSGAMEPGKIGAMRDAAVGGLNRLVGELESSAGVPSTAILEAVIAGNTAMNHLLLGLPVASLAVSPFSGLFSALPPVPAEAAGLRIHPSGRIYIAPNIRSFVGGDISAGLAAIDIEALQGNHLFLDLGTNGEIVLKNGPRFTTTSTAAGPAFEGMSISCGMLASPGAVHQASLEGGRITVRTIGGAPPRGVCGTGLIDLVALAVETGLMTRGGHILDPSKKIAFAGDLALTQKDIREVQLATAAIKTGMRMLLDEAGLGVEELDGLIVAGAFGNELDIDRAMAIGLLPRLDRDRVRFIGNSSLAGARALLLSRTERARCESLVGRIRHVGLAQGEAFQRTYVEAMELAPWPA